MSLPFEILNGSQRELGLVVAVLVGFGFGFVLERSGFGRAQKLVGQFYGNDMTVFKVMFSAIVTAMLGTVLFAGLGWIDLRAVADSVASPTYLWPMLVGGLLLGVGFITSGYCPGTSFVASASGKWDGLVTVVGVVLGTLVYAEVQPALGAFHTSGSMGNLYLYDLLHVPPAVVAAFVTLFAVAAFIGAEWIERKLNKALPRELPGPQRRYTWAGLGVAAAAGLATLLVPVGTNAAATNAPVPVTAAELARRVLDEPWNLRVLDLRAGEACARARVPGAECVPREALKNLALAELPVTRDLVLVGDDELPKEALAYHGRTYVLTGGFPAWERYALTAPSSLPADATAQQREAYKLQSGIHAALTGVPQAPPPPAPTAGGPAPKKKAGGGCGG